MIYLKAKELEDAYWGYDVEEYWDQDANSDGDMSSGESRRPRHHTSSSGKHFTKSRRDVRFTKSDQESDADSETSQSSVDKNQRMRKSKRLTSTRKSKHSKKDADLDAQIRLLMEELKRLQVKQQRSGNQTSAHNRRWKNRG